MSSSFESRVPELLPFFNQAKVGASCRDMIRPFQSSVEKLMVHAFKKWV